MDLQQFLMGLAVNIGTAGVAGYIGVRVAIAETRGEMRAMKVGLDAFKEAMHAMKETHDENISSLEARMDRLEAPHFRRRSEQGGM